jgi:hypothetical protein
MIGEASVLVCGDECEQLAREKIRSLTHGWRTEVGNNVSKDLNSPSGPSPRSRF